MSNFIVSAAELQTHQIADFQTEMGDAPDPNRFYLEYLAMTNQVNRNFVEVTDAALEMMAAGYKTGLPLTINHMKGIFDTSLGIGQTIDALVRQGALYLQAYIAKGKTYNLDTIGNSEELIEAIKDGYVKRGSTSIRIVKAHCNVCSEPVEDFYGCEVHPKGQKVHIRNDAGEMVEKVAHIVIEAAEAVEFSITMLRADPHTEVTRKNLNFYTDTVIDEETFNAHFSGRTLPSKGDPQKQEELIVTEQEKQALEAERDAEKRRADALQNSVDSLTLQLKTQTDTIAELRATVAENTILVQDGKAARKVVEDQYIDEYTAYVGDSCTQEKQDAQRELIKDFTLETIQSKLESMREHNAKNYPEGRSLGGESADSDPLVSHVDPD